MGGSFARKGQESGQAFSTPIHASDWLSEAGGGWVLENLLLPLPSPFWLRSNRKCVGEHGETYILSLIFINLFYYGKNI